MPISVVQNYYQEAQNTVLRLGGADAPATHAIAPPATSNDVVFPQAGEKLSGNLLKSKVTSIARTLKEAKYFISEDVVRQKIFEKYPYVDDWMGNNPDSRKEIVAELKREYQNINKQGEKQ